MKYDLPCEVVRDLMPSYVDELLSPESKSYVDDHLRNCEECRKEYSEALRDRKEDDKANAVELENDRKEIDFLKKVKKRSRRPLIATGVFLALLVLASVYVLVPLNIGPARLDSADMDDLMKQVAASEITTDYSEYVPNEAFAKAKIFGIRRKGNEGTAYAYLFTGDYAAVKGKAYLRSAGTGEAKVYFKYTDKGPKLTSVEWCDDGVTADKWLSDNFPYIFWIRDRLYVPYEDNGTSKLERSIWKDVEREMKVPVEKEDLLMVDLDEGTYEIVRTIESGETQDDYKFDTETVDKGKLEDLKSE